MGKTKLEEDEAITRGTGNVFADLGYPDAEERQTRLRLAYAINQIFAKRHLTQVDAAALLGVNQPKIPALAALDRDVEIVIKKKPRTRETAHIKVGAA